MNINKKIGVLLIIAIIGALGSAAEGNLAFLGLFIFLGILAQLFALEIKLSLKPQSDDGSEKK